MRVLSVWLLRFFPSPKCRAQTHLPALLGCSAMKVASIGLAALIPRVVVAIPLHVFRPTPPWERFAQAREGEPSGILPRQIEHACMLLCASLCSNKLISDYVLFWQHLYFTVARMLEIQHASFAHCRHFSVVTWPSRDLPLRGVHDTIYPFCPFISAPQLCHLPLLSRSCGPWGDRCLQSMVIPWSFRRCTSLSLTRSLLCYLCFGSAVNRGKKPHCDVIL